MRVRGCGGWQTIDPGTYADRAVVLVGGQVIEGDMDITANLALELRVSRLCASV